MKIKRKRFKEEELDLLDHEDIEKDAKKGRGFLKALGIGGTAIMLLKEVDWNELKETTTEFAGFVAELMNKGKR